MHVFQHVRSSFEHNESYRVSQYNGSRDPPSKKELYSHWILLFHHHNDAIRKSALIILLQIRKQAVKRKNKMVSRISLSYSMTYCRLYLYVGYVKKKKKCIYVGYVICLLYHYILSSVNQLRNRFYQ
jgi:hypothetical protein